MKKIELINSLYHGILNEEFTNDYTTIIQLSKLRSVLKLGYIIPPSSTRVKECNSYYNHHNSWYPNDLICLSSHPFSSLSIPVSTNFSKKIKYDYTSYLLTMSGPTIILDKLMLDNCLSVETGALKYEVLVKDDIDLKYMLGICNTGIDINNYILFDKYYLLYKANQISEEEFKNKIKAFFFYEQVPNLDIYLNYDDSPKKDLKF